MKKIAMVVASVALAMTLGCSGKAAEQTNETIKATTESKAVTQSNQTLLFFMNPNGMPCKMQDNIINDMGLQDNPHVQIKYVKTTEMATARPLFAQFGIRALPSMILLDENGSVKKRFTPGIQSKETIEAALN